MVNISKTLAYNSQVQTVSLEIGQSINRNNDCPKCFSSHGWIFGKSVLFAESMKDFGYELDTCSTVHVSHSVSVFGHFSNWLCSCFKL